MIKRYIGYKNSQPYYEQVIKKEEKSTFLVSEIKYFNGYMIRESLNINEEKNIIYTNKKSGKSDIYIEAKGEKISCYINGVEVFFLNSNRLFLPIMIEKKELLDNAKERYGDYLGIYDNEMKDELIALPTRFVQRNKNETVMICPRRIVLEYTDDGYIKESFDIESNIRRKLVE